jgi:hypothetical protein
MKKTLFSTLLLLLALVVCTQAQKLDKFGSSVTKQVGPKTIAVPYTDVISYLGYAAPNTEDEVKDGKKFYYVYVWIPLAAPELGVRMMSPVGTAKIKDAAKATDFDANAMSTDYFDTYITLERSDIIQSADITAAKIKSAKWVTLERNDDSGEMPAQPSGSSYNSLLRYKSDINDPLKALTAGLYRVGFTTYKTGEVKGTFLAEVAAPIKLPGVAVAKTPDGIRELLAAK